jgi:predicted DNA-binding transcriptional regulator YafY
VTDEAKQVEPTVKFVYRNWRDEIRERTVTPLRVWYGRTDWHPAEQWFMEAIDSENGNKRDFALADILTFEPERFKRDRWRDEAIDIQGSLDASPPYPA